MNKDKFIGLSDLDKVKFCVEQSLEEHKKFTSEYWKGSAFMGESILDLIKQIKDNYQKGPEIQLDHVRKILNLAVHCDFDTDDHKSQSATYDFLIEEFHKLINKEPLI